MAISIKGLNKAKLLAALYNASKPQGLGFIHYGNEPMTEEQAEQLLRRQTYFDYLQGRVMKIDLSSDEEIEPWGYDRDNGTGAVQYVVDELRATDDVYTETMERMHLEAMHASAQALHQHLDIETKIKEFEGSVEIALGMSQFSEMLAPILLKILGESLDEEDVLAQMEADVDVKDIRARSWYKVKTNPTSEEARRIAGQIVAVESFDRKTDTVAVFTMSVFQNKGGVAVRIPVGDLTNK